MVVLQTTEEWQRQTSLLLQARPTTTLISVKYNIPNLSSSKHQKLKQRKQKSGDEASTAASTPMVPRALLCLKAYDPESGVCLKCETDRAAEVGRLINGLGKLGRHMAALPQKTEDTVMEDAPAGDAATVTEQNQASIADNPTAPGKGQPPPAAGGGKKKKKGKK